MSKRVNESGMHEEKIMRSHQCGDIRAEQIEASVQLCGWVHRRRDHGGVIFLDVRDHKGIVQVVFDPDTVESLILLSSKLLISDFKSWYIICNLVVSLSE